MLKERLTPCPRDELPPGWHWVEWTNPPVACSRCQATGLRAAFKRSVGPDIGKYFCTDCGPDGIRDRMIKETTLSVVKEMTSGPRRRRVRR